MRRINELTKAILAASQSGDKALTAKLTKELTPNHNATYEGGTHHD